MANTQPARTDLSPTQAASLLASLVAQHGDGVLAALLAAGLSQDVAQAQEDADPTDEEQAVFDAGWFVGFAEHPAFRAALSADAAAALDEDSLFV